MNTSNFTTIISLDNLLTAWNEFARGKRNKADVQLFERDLMDNLMALHEELKAETYRHGGYHEFKINDPKPRRMSKASVRDRLVHHAIYQALYPYFDARFIADSFSCRVNKGTHAGGLRFRKLAAQGSLNYTRTCWALKCDIKQFFASIDHEVIISILARHIFDQRLLAVMKDIVQSFSTNPGKGLPLGNLTSQLLANVYMNELDQFVKHEFKEKLYIRYADDFIFLDPSHDHLQSILPKIQDFLDRSLKLSLHPAKVSIGTVFAGVDFLGWIHYPTHRILRTVTRKRMERRIKASPVRETIQSYIGLLQHGNAYGLLQYCESMKELYL